MGKGREARVGLVFFIGLAFLLVLTIIIGRGELAIHRGHYTIDVMFENVQGLRKNDVVELAGMEIGRVDGIKLEDELIRVTLRIDNAYRIRKDASITIGEKSLIGGKMVAVSMGEEKETIQPGSTVIGKTAPTPLEIIQGASGFAEELQKRLKEADRILPEMESLLKSLNRISSAIEDGTGTIGKLVMEDEVYHDLSETIKTARSVSEEFAEVTKRIDRLKTFIGADTAYNFESSHFLTGVYVRIEPRPEKLYLIGGKALSGSGTRWSEEDDFHLELDLQVGRRWLDNRLTGRIGAFESRFGAGIDYKFNDRISMTVEGRDVWTGPKDEGISPFLLRGRMNLRLARGLYIHAGVDDILDTPGLNMGVRFEYSDEDIKYLLGIMNLGI